MRLVYTCTADLSTEVILGQHSRLLTYCVLLPQPCTQAHSHFLHTRKSWIRGCLCLSICMIFMVKRCSVFYIPSVLLDTVSGCLVV